MDARTHAWTHRRTRRTDGGSRVSKKITEFLGEEEKSLVDFIVGKIASHDDATEFVLLCSVACAHALTAILGATGFVSV